MELLRAGVRAVLADLFGAYADRRELQAALYPLAGLEHHDYSGSDNAEVWLDFVADVGDGFNATYSIASLIAKETLSVPWSATDAHPNARPAASVTRRGALLVMGGDEVYPTATRIDYQDRTVGPYRAAFSWIADEASAPHLFAIPGNHDWYDGLTAFLRQFTQQRWFGAWKTRQRRSYFTLELPHRYFLWGIDIQLSADVDGAQLDYFRAQAKRLVPKDRVILCTSEPSWLKDVEEPNALGYKNLQYLMREVERCGAEVVLVLTGDSHHYARYLERYRPEPAAEVGVAGSSDGSPIRSTDRERLYLTAGGGGAFLHGTHALPKQVVQPGLDESSAPDLLELKATFPDAATSEAQVLKLWKFPFHNWGFAALWAMAWLLLSLTLTSASPSRLGTFDPRTTLFTRFVQSSHLSLSEEATPWVTTAACVFILWAFARVVFRRQLTRMESSLKRLPVDVLPWASGVVLLVSHLLSGAPSPLGALASALSRSPASLLLLLLIVVGSVVYVNHSSKWLKLGIGACHAFIHVLVWLELCGLTVSLSTELRGVPGLAPVLPFLWLIGSSLLAGGVSAVIFGLFLWFAGRYLPGQLNDVFSALGIQDFKNFLRLHIDASGKLTVYPVGLERVPQSWRVNESEEDDAPFIVPGDGQRLEPRLIERPLSLERSEPQIWSQA